MACVRFCFVSSCARSPLVVVLHGGLCPFLVMLSLFCKVVCTVCLGFRVGIFAREVGGVRFPGEVGGLATFSRCPLP